MLTTKKFNGQILVKQFFHFKKKLYSYHIDFVTVKNYNPEDEMWQHVTRWSHGIEVNFKARDGNYLLVKTYFPFDPKVWTIPAVYIYCVDPH